MNALQGSLRTLGAPFLPHPHEAVFPAMLHVLIHASHSCAPAAQALPAAGPECAGAGAHPSPELGPWGTAAAQGGWGDSCWRAGSSSSSSSSSSSKWQEQQPRAATAAVSVHGACGERQKAHGSGRRREQVGARIHEVHAAAHLNIMESVGMYPLTST
eukprot:1157365-Pelagomonas_calceolata.AAC.2